MYLSTLVDYCKLNIPKIDSGYVFNKDGKRRCKDNMINQ